MHVRHPRRHRPSALRLGRLLAVLACVAMVLVGCDDDPDLGQPGLAEHTDPETEFPMAGEAQPAPGGGPIGGAPPDDERAGIQPVDGDFAEVPLPPGAEPFAAATEEEGVTVQTFHVTASSPSQVADFFREELPPLNWEEGAAESVTAAPTEGPETIRLSFTNQGQTLLVSVADLDRQDSQFSLSLSG